MANVNINNTTYTTANCTSTYNPAIHNPVYGPNNPWPQSNGTLVTNPNQFGNGLFTTTSNGTTSWIGLEENNSMVNFSWLVAQFSYTKFPRKIKYPICVKCKEQDNGANEFPHVPSLDMKELFKTKCLYCHKAVKNLFVWKDDPPDECPYILEHTVSEDNAE